MSSYATDGQALERARPSSSARAASSGTRSCARCRAAAAAAARGVRIVHYHWVFDDERERFARQLACLAREFSPCRSRRRSSGCAHGRVGGRRDRRSRSTTGSATSSTNAAPLLAEHGFSACFFLVTELVAAPPTRSRAFCRERLHLPLPVEPLDWDDAARLLELGHEVGSHTRSHRELTALEPGRSSRTSSTARASELARRLGAVPALQPPRTATARASPTAVAGGGAGGGLRELRDGDPGPQRVRRRPLRAAARPPRRALAAARRSRTSSADERRRAHAEPARDRVPLPRAAAAGRAVILDEGAVGGVEPAPAAAEAAPRRAHRRAGRARAAARVRGGAGEGPPLEEVGVPRSCASRR